MGRVKNRVLDEFLTSLSREERSDSGPQRENMLVSL